MLAHMNSVGATANVPAERLRWRCDRADLEPEVVGEVVEKQLRKLATTLVQFGAGAGRTYRDDHQANIGKSPATA